ncbi:aquaporin [Krasilnikovia sp. M28-CT-15]|uniref:aquaporin n=1 Tax=Krasilnikovia sp. M28-CT-15 TaxID=3373540 RepID=UPI0038767BBC
MLTATFPRVGIGILGVAFAFGLTVLTMAYSFGHISGGHFNPAVTLGLWLGRRAPGRDVLPYAVTQVVAAVAAAGVLYGIASGTTGFTTDDGFAANGYGAHSPGGYTLWLFWIAPLAGAALAGAGYRFVVGDTGREPVAEEAQDTAAAERSAGDRAAPG